MRGDACSGYAIHTACALPKKAPYSILAQQESIWTMLGTDGTWAGIAAQ